VQELLTQLSVFRGGWTAEAAESVCSRSEVPSWIHELREHSLVIAEERGDSMRYRMLETVREFAGGLVPEPTALELRSRHAEYFLSLAQEKSKAIDGPHEAAALADLAADLDNVRAAMDWAVDAGQVRTAVRFAVSLADFLWHAGYWLEHAERVDLGLRAARDLSPPDCEGEARLLRSRARVAYDRGQTGVADEACRQGLRTAGRCESREWRGAFLNLLALIAMGRGDKQEAGRLLEESQAQFREAGHVGGQGMALHNQGLLAYSEGEREHARDLYTQALPLRIEAGDLRGSAETQNNLALLAEEDGQLDLAETAYVEALQSFVEVGDVLWTAVALCNVGETALKAGRPERAVDLTSAAEQALRRLGSPHADHAGRVLREAASELGQPLPEPSGPWRDHLMSAARRALQ
jgi:tetratricopeptide (TPR) repeat protein